MKSIRPFSFNIKLLINVYILTAGILSGLSPAAAEEKTVGGDAAVKYEFLDLSIAEGRLVFSLTVKENTDLYVADFKKVEISPLVTGPGVEEYPTWSPDGKKIAFYSDREGGDREIFSANSDGTEITRLTTSKGPDEDPNWSADGKKLVFSSARAGKGMNLFSMSPDGSNLEQLTDTPNNNTVPKWSPRGDEILYSTNAYWPGWDVMLFEFSTRNPKVMTRGYQSFCRASWNPDGSAFVFSYGSAKDIDLWTQVKGESRPEPLTQMDGREYDGIYVDKNRVLFTADEGEPSGRFQVWLINADSRKTFPIFKIAGSARYLSYTPFPSVEAIAEELKTEPAGAAAQTAAGTPLPEKTDAPAAAQQLQADTPAAQPSTAPTAAGGSSLPGKPE